MAQNSLGVIFKGTTFYRAQLTIKNWTIVTTSLLLLFNFKNVLPELVVGLSRFLGKIDFFPLIVIVFFRGSYNSIKTCLVLRLKWWLLYYSQICFQVHKYGLLLSYFTIIVCMLWGYRNLFRSHRSMTRRTIWAKNVVWREKPTCWEITFRHLKQIKECITIL